MNEAIKPEPIVEAVLKALEKQHGVSILRSQYKNDGDNIIIQYMCDEQYVQEVKIIMETIKV